MGWDESKWEGQQFPTAVRSICLPSSLDRKLNSDGSQADLDNHPLLHGRPIALRRRDGHAFWVSPRVLELMGPLPATIAGGDIIRDLHGNPTGAAIHVQ